MKTSKKPARAKRSETHKMAEKTLSSAQAMKALEKFAAEDNFIEAYEATCEGCGERFIRVTFALPPR